MFEKPKFEKISRKSFFFPFLIHLLLLITHTHQFIINVNIHKVYDNQNDELEERRRKNLIELQFNQSILKDNVSLLKQLISGLTSNDFSLWPIIFVSFHFLVPCIYIYIYTMNLSVVCSHLYIFLTWPSFFFHLCLSH